MVSFGAHLEDEQTKVTITGLLPDYSQQISSPHALSHPPSQLEDSQIIKFSLLLTFSLPVCSFSPTSIFK